MRSFKLLLTALMFLALSVGMAFAQKQPFTQKVFALVNEARTRPQEFLEKHKDEITGDNPKFGKQLQGSSPLEAVIWDPGLEAWCKTKLGKTSLNPPYTGKIKLCGNGAGMKGSTGGFTPLQVVIDFHANLLDPNCKYLGIYFDATGENYWYSWGYRCDVVTVAYTYTTPVDSSKVDFAKLNTANSADYFSALEKRMVLEINFVRIYPKVYAKIIGQYLNGEANSSSGLSHDDWVAGVELIEELEAMEPVAILQPQPCIYEAAKAHGLDCARRGFLDHTGSNGSQPWDRILKNCAELQHGNENLVGGSASARESVIELLIDSGISNRGHRYNMLNAEWRYVGVFHYLGKMSGFEGVHHWVENFGR